MKNPWQNILLDDYENHMKLDNIKQLPIMNKMMKNQFYRYPIKTMMILGIAGGNGLEHIDVKKFHKIYGIDINQDYLQECKRRYQNLSDILECLCIDLTNNCVELPKVDMLIANLLIEYIGYDCFQRIINKLRCKYVSMIIQVNDGDTFVSDSPYLHVFDDLNQVHHQIKEDELILLMNKTGYNLITIDNQLLPNNKKLVQLDFVQKG